MTATRAARNLVNDHLLALHIGSEVTQWFRKEREPHVLGVTPENVIAALHRAGIRPVLMGAHGINVYRDQARATQDVDVLVTKRQVGKALRVLKMEFPDLEVVDTPIVARFVDPVTRKVVLDLMKPSSHALQVVFRHTVAIADTHRIPTLEMALVSKFVAINAPTRPRVRRLQDLADFAAILEHNRAAVDVKRLLRLAGAAALGCGNRLRTLIADLDAGHTIHLD